MNRRDILKGMAASIAFPASGAFAQGGRSIRMIVPLPPGTSNDSATRIISSVWSPMINQPIIVDNRAGANGVIGAMELIRSKPDGLTLMNGSLSPLAANVAFVKNLPYDPLKDVSPIAAVTLTNHVLVVAPDSPIKSFPEFIEFAKKQKPGSVSVGYSTAIAQLQIATINKMAGIELLAVPYKGVPASVTDVMGGVLTATLGNPGPTIAYEKSGRLRVLGVSSLQRNPVTPNWPAMSETLPGFDFPSWNAIVGPPGMSKDLIGELHEQIVKALKTKEVVDRLAAEATIPMFKGPEELRAYMEAEIKKYVTLGKEAGIEAE